MCVYDHSGTASNDLSLTNEAVYGRIQSLLMLEIDKSYTIYACNILFFLM